MANNNLIWNFHTYSWIAATTATQPAEVRHTEGYWAISMTRNGLFSVGFPWGIEPLMSMSASEPGVFTSLHAAKEYCQFNENRQLATQDSQTEKLNKLKRDKENWVKWLLTYGAENLLDSFLANVEGSQSTCKHCGEAIYVDILVGGGCPDWSTEDGDFGCRDSPDTNKKGTGRHSPRRRVWQNSKWVPE